MWSFLRFLVAPQKPRVAVTTTDQLDTLFTALSEIINDETAKSAFAKQYQGIQASDFSTKQIKATPIFVALMSYLLSHQPPATKAATSQEDIQKLVAATVTLSDLEPSLWGALGTGTLQTAGILGYGIDQLLLVYQAKMDQMMARKALDEMIKKLPREIPPETYSKISASDHPSLRPLYLDLATLPQEDVLNNFRFLYKFYLEELVVQQTQVKTAELLQTIFNFISQSYDQEHTLTFLDTVPNGWLEQQRGNLLGRDELLKVLTELQEEKDKVEAAKIRNEALLASIGDGVVATDMNGGVIFMNQPASELLGWQMNDSTELNWFEKAKLVTDKDKPVPLEKHPMKVALDTNQKIITSDYSYLRSDGSKVPVAVTATPFILNGQTAGAMLVLKDITHEKEVDRQKTEFISVASHQLRTPLGSMKWNLEMLRKGYYGEVPKEANDVIEQIRLVNERTVKLVNTLLNISRIESGRVQDHPSDVNIMDVIESTIKEVTPIAEGKKVTIELHKPDQKLPILTIDGGRLREVFENIMSNAVKYGANGTVLVTVSKDEKYIQLEFADQGMGIPEKEQFKVFSRFFRAENAINQEPDGSGFGLFVVKSYVESWGGKIWFKSPTMDNHRGTTFYIQLPLVIPVSNDQTIAAALEPTSIPTKEKPEAAPTPKVETAPVTPRPTVIHKEKESHGYTNPSQS